MLGIGADQLVANETELMARFQVFVGQFVPGLNVGRGIGQAGHRALGAAVGLGCFVQHGRPLVEVHARLYASHGLIGYI